tara:strand:+ start:3557 stop:4543 length:987 start_codon:yes stop_codon:yes gene_type:complete
MTNDFVSVIIPCRDEEAYIGKCLSSILNNNFPKDLYEIIILDGKSKDNTVRIIKNFQRKYSNIKLFVNHEKTKPHALNLGIKHAKGTIVMRIDAHANYPEDYISKLVIGLEKHNADNFGGIRKTYEGHSLIENIVSILISHPFAVGNAYWRTESEHIREVDTVFCGCYRKSTFDKIGLFNTKLLRTQDREFNYRLLNSGGKIVLDPKIVITYFPRKNIFKILAWNFEGSFWLFISQKYTSTKPLALRNFIPLFFTIYIFLLPCTFFTSASSIFYTPFILYMVLNLFFSVKNMIRFKKFFILPLNIIFFPLYHISYGLGSLFGLLKRFL